MNHRHLIEETQKDFQDESKKLSTRLEQAWAKYKYLILEHSPQTYHAIRQLLKDKEGDNRLEFLSLVEGALSQEPIKSQQLNALDHVWGYFKQAASDQEKDTFQDLKSDWMVGKIPMDEVKTFLLSLAEKYQQTYLLSSYYFDSAKDER